LLKSIQRDFAHDIPCVVARRKASSSRLEQGGNLTSRDIFIRSEL
jgi:hypothetical protein